SVPAFKGLRQSRKKNGARADALEKNGLASEFYGEIPPWEDSDPMLPYYEALRDRVVMSYNGDNHKPKVVGLTSCNDGAGVTRLATGLAAALSRDVQRNVRLKRWPALRLKVTGKIRLFRRIFTALRQLAGIWPGRVSCKASAI